MTSRKNILSYIQRHAQMLDYQGKLAYTWGWEIQKDTPVEKREIRVSKIPTKMWPELIDRFIEDWRENTGVVYREYHSYPAYIHAEDFNEHVIETRPIPRPRKGKDRWGRYDWKYVGDGFIGPYWEKVYYEENN